METLSQQILDFYRSHTSFNSRHLKSSHSDLYYAILETPCKISTENIAEKAYCISHSLEEIPKCICGNLRPFYSFKVGYAKYCCKECGKKGWKTKREHTCLEKYGVTSPLASKKIREQINQTNLEKYGSKGPTHSTEVREKVKQTNLERYGIENPGQSKELMEKATKTKEERFGKEWGKEINKKAQQTNLELYGAKTTFEFAKEQIEQTNLKKYGAKNVFGSSLIKEKIKQTNLGLYGVENPLIQLPHKTSNISKEELRVFELLKSKFSKVEHQYSSEDYPWFCDFYVPEENLYIECNFHWTHGGRPFILEDGKEQLETWSQKAKTSEFYKNAINTWIVRDIAKRNRAKKLKLNWLEFFTFKECKEWIREL